MPTLIGRCGGSSSLSAWASLKQSGTLSVPPAPDPNSSLQIDWTGATFKYSNPQAVAVSGGGIILGSDGNPYVAVVNVQVVSDINGTGGIGAWTIPGFRIAAGSADTMSGIGTQLNVTEGVYYRYNGAGATVLTAVYGVTWIGAVGIQTSGGVSFDVTLINQAATNPTASITTPLVRIALMPVPDDFTTTVA